MGYDGPRATIELVLRKLSIDPRERMEAGDQDPEYTACRAEEIVRYFQLYKEANLTSDERAVLCCFLLQCLNDHAQDGAPHPLQEDIIASLFGADSIHSAELDYWMDTSDPDEENWWPITKALLRHRRIHTTP
jgi:hypothetical protein